MKKIILVIITSVYGISFRSSAQLSLNFQRCTNCPTQSYSMTEPTGGFTYSSTTEIMGSSNVASDFGRRGGNNSQWHIGVDFSSAAGDDDLGDQFFPIETGTIVKLIGTGYKRLAISGTHRFGYGHLFFNGTPTSAGMRSGNFVLKKMDAPNSNYYAIIYTGSTVQAFGEINGTVTHPLLNGGNPISVSNSVTSTTTPIAPIGNSGGNFTAHIHLYNFQNDPVDNDFASGLGGYNATRFRNPKNPLQYLAHTSPTYVITYPKTNLVYPGNSRSYFKVRVALSGETGGGPYSSAVMDVDGVELFLKPHGQPTSAYKVIQGTVNDSRIAYGGRISNDRYPSDGFPANNAGVNAIDISKETDGEGTTDRTGMVPFAYNTQAYDEYYFSDFYSRIHKSDNYGGTNATYSQVNEDARYSDGLYDYYAKVTKATGATQDGATQTLVIDNFKPYIKTVIVRLTSEDGALVEKDSWEWNGSQITLYKENFVDAGPLNNVWIKVISSEPLQAESPGFVGINIPTVDGQQYRAMTPVSGTNNTEFVITYSAFGPTGTNQINISGFDYGNNQLERMATSPATVPMQLANNAWSAPSDPGIDQNHAFNSGNGTCQSPGGRVASENCLVVDFDSNEREITPGSTVTFTSEASGSGTLQYQWDFGNGASPATASTTGPHVVRYNTTGSKTVSLTVIDQNGQALKTKSAYILVTQNPNSTDFTAYPTSGTQTLVVSFSGISASPTSTWSWSFPGGNPSTSTQQNPVVKYVNSGTYDVSLTVDGVNSITKPGVISVGLAPTLTASIQSCDNNNFTGCATSYDQYQGIYFSASAIGGTPLYTYQWDFGNGATSSSMEPLYSYNSPGNYLVTLTVTDARGVTASSVVTIAVGSVTPTISAAFTTSDTNITAGEGPVIFTDATTSSKIDLSYVEYYWDFGEDAYPRYAYTKGPHQVCYDNWVNNKSIFYRVHDPITNVTSDAHGSVYVAAGNVSQCYNYTPRWESPKGVSSAATIQNCLYPGINVGIENGDLSHLTCNIAGSIDDCIFDPSHPCFSDTWFSSHGTVSMRNDGNNSFRLFTSGYYYAAGNQYFDWSEGVYYQHPQNFWAGKRYIFTFSAAVSNYDEINNNGRSIIDHLKVFLTRDLRPNLNCVNDDTNYSPPTYEFSQYELGSFEYAINTTAWNCYEVYFYPPDNNFNQIWIYPQVETTQVAKTYDNKKDEWILLDNFSLRVDGDANCAADLIVDNFNYAPGLAEAGMTLRTSGSVNVLVNQSATFKAGQSISLKPGFTATRGSTFDAKIGACGAINGRQVVMHDSVTRIIDGYDNYRVNYRKASSPKKYIGVVEPMGGNNTENHNFSLSPNPSNDQITISGFIPKGDVVISLVNLFGVELVSKAIREVESVNEVFDVSTLAKGVYYAKIKTGTDIKVIKFVVH